MTQALTPDLQQALRAANPKPPEFLETETGKVYVLIEKEQLILRDDVASIQRGLDQLNAGAGRTNAESKFDLAQRLGFAPGK